LKEELHYKLVGLNFENGAEIFWQGQECFAISFLVSGCLELYVEKSDNTLILLETLTPGSNVGAYSVLNQSSYRYTIKAKGSVALLILEQVQLFNFADEHQEVGSAMNSALNFI
jgi:CRP-like cAMP-binding protein